MKKMEENTYIVDENVVLSSANFDETNNENLTNEIPNDGQVSMENRESADTEERINEKACVVCHKLEGDKNNPLQDVKKGLGSLLTFSKKFNHTTLEQYLLRQEQLLEDDRIIKLHKKCQRDVYNKNKKRTASSADLIAEKTKHKILRSSMDTFNWKQNCIFCGETCQKDIKHPDRNNCHEVTTLHFKDQVLSACQRRDDQVSKNVALRVSSCNDLVAVEARYHDSCRITFVNSSKVLNAGENKQDSGSKPEIEKLHYFDQLCDWIEQEAECYTIKELHQKMIDMAGSPTVYTVKWLKKKLIQKYDNHLFFAESKGKSDIVCLKNFADLIVNNSWYEKRETDLNKESERIIETAAKLILSDIRSMTLKNDLYPLEDEIADIKKCEELLPTSLRKFLEVLIKGRVRRTAIGQVMVSCARPRSSVLPIPFGLGVEMDNMFGSRWLIDELSKLGFSVSYDEVKRYKQSVVIHDDSLTSMEISKANFTQWIADNVDHDISTLDGKNTFHGMGIIAASIGRTCDVPIQIPRVKRKLVSEITTDRGIPITQYLHEGSKALASIKFTPISNINIVCSTFKSRIINLIWHMGYFFKKQQPHWSGFMQRYVTGDHPGKSTVNFLPVINLNPSDESCIYSTLIFIEKQAKHLAIPTPCVTFDQPLFIKAFEISKSKGMEIVIRLGGFHLLMSFLGGVGTVMEGCGLKESLETIYAQNSVNHMLDGKAYARAVRGHFLNEVSLQQLIINKMVLTDNKIEQHYLDEVKKLYDNMFNSEEETDDTATEFSLENEHLQTLNTMINEYKTHLSESSRTSKLWIQYIYYISLIKDFIYAERTGDWALHLQTVKSMLNLFAAAGRINYAKSARLYLQSMYELPEKHPWLHQCFQEYGYHTIRRSNRFWAGLWSDLIIEQVLMRSMKSRGGLSRGRGMSENVIAMWIHSMHRLAGVHSAMSSLTGQIHQTSEQHIELRESRINRDLNDIAALQCWFEDHSPFTGVKDLISIVNGVTASDDSNVNCDKAEEVGAKIQASLDNIEYQKSKIKRNDKVITMASLQSAIRIADEKVPIDPMTLFSRLVVLVMREKDFVPYFFYELSPYPPSLFKDGIMRDPGKYKLRDYLTKNVKKSSLPNSVVHIIDGGALLHWVQWAPNITFSGVVKQYREFLLTEFGPCIIVFDGYNNGPTTKDLKHQSRGSKLSQTVTVDLNKKVETKQEKFLKNGKNKTMLIGFLRDDLRAHMFKIYEAKGDADTLIVKIAHQQACENSAVVVHADDADVFCLLMYHCKDVSGDVFFKTVKKSSEGRQTWSIQDIIENVDACVLDNILFLHAWSGCDTTSGTFGMGKTSIVTKLRKSKQLQDLAATFSKDNATREEIGSAGVEIFLKSYATREKSLGMMRYTKYMEIAATKEGIKIESLAPSEGAAYQHSYRVYLQVMDWKFLEEAHFNPLEWNLESFGLFVKIHIIQYIQPNLLHQMIY